MHMHVHTDWAGAVSRKIGDANFNFSVNWAPWGGNRNPGQVCTSWMTYGIIVYLSIVQQPNELVGPWRYEVSNISFIHARFIHA